MAGGRFSYQRASNKNRALIDKARLNVKQTAAQFATAESLSLTKAKGVLAEARRLEGFRQIPHPASTKKAMKEDYLAGTMPICALCEKYGVSLTWFNAHVRSEVTKSKDGHTEPRMDPYGLLRKPINEWGAIVMEARA